MKSHFILRFLIVFTILFSNLTLQSQTKSFLTESQAKEEAVIVINHIKNSHPNQYWANSKDIWDAYEKKLLDRKGFISIAQHYFDIAYLFSLATDTHTQIYPDISTPSFQTVYPIRFRSFADGLYVLAAGEGYEDYIGKKVKSFGGMPTDQFMSILANYVSADNMERKKTLAEFLLIMPDTYQVFNLSRNKAVAIELEDINGNLSSGLLKMVEDKAFAKIFFEEPDSFGILVPQGWKTVYDVLGIKKPITRKFLRKKYWHTTLTNKQGKLVEYIQINKNNDEKKGEQQFDFLLRVFQDIRKKGSIVDRIVIDLRYNLGGWIKNTAALSGLLYGSDFYKPGKTIVLIGRESVSAGTILAADIEEKNYAYYIGEPTGSKPNMFLDHKQVDLPYSKFYAESSTDTYIVTNTKDSRKFIAPDYNINERFLDFISGEDIILNKALGIGADEIKISQDGLYRSELWRRPSQKIAMHKK